MSLLSMFVKLPTKEAITDTTEPEAVPENYKALAAQAGFTGYAQLASSIDRQVKLANFRRYLAEIGVCVYPEEKVYKYLHRTRPGYNTEVVWRALDGNYKEERLTNRSRLDSTPYAKRIPEPVLITMGRIRKTYPSTTFWISDYAKVRPKVTYDPFLAVEYMTEYYIIERWDEPGFRM